VPSSAVEYFSGSCFSTVTLAPNQRCTIDYHVGITPKTGMYALNVAGEQFDNPGALIKVTFLPRHLLVYTANQDNSLSLKACIIAQDGSATTCELLLQNKRIYSLAYNKKLHLLYLSNAHQVDALSLDNLALMFTHSQSYLAGTIMLNEDATKIYMSDYSDYKSLHYCNLNSDTGVFEDCQTYNTGTKDTSFAVLIDDKYIYLTGRSNIHKYFVKCKLLSDGAIDSCEVLSPGSPGLPIAYNPRARIVYQSNYYNNTMQYYTVTSDGVIDVGSKTNAPVANMLKTWSVNYFAADNHLYLADAANDMLYRCGLKDDGKIKACVLLRSDADIGSFNDIFALSVE
jgi:hypothetical protein